MLSVRSCSPPEMKILVPLTRYAVAMRHGLGAHQPQVAAGVRLGQAHGGQPLAGGDLFQVARLQFVAAVVLEALVGAVQQARRHGPAVVGRAQHFVQHGFQHGGQALAAVFGGAGQRGPAGLPEGLVGLAEARRCRDHAAASKRQPVSSPMRCKGAISLATNFPASSCTCCMRSASTSAKGGRACSWAGVSSDRRQDVLDVVKTRVGKSIRDQDSAVKPIFLISGPQAWTLPPARPPFPPGRAARDQADDGQAVDDRFVLERGIDGGVGGLQHVLRCLGRCVEAEPFFGGQVREALFGEGRHFRHVRASASGRRWPECAACRPCSWQ